MSNLSRMYKYMKQFGFEVDPEDLHKTASADSAQEAEAVFADPVRKEYPIHTKTAAVKSIIKFFGEELNDEVPKSPYPRKKIAGTLEDAALAWNVRVILQSVQKQFDGIRKRAATTSAPRTKYAFTLSLPGRTYRAFPVTTPAEISKSAGMFRKEARKLRYASRVKVAKAILGAAAECDMPTSAFGEEDIGYLQKAAGLIPRNPADAAGDLSLFLATAPDGIRKFAAQIIDELEDTDPADLCAALDDNIKTYDKDTRLPEEILFDSEDTARPSVKLSNGNEVSEARLKTAGVKVWSAFGDEAVEAVCPNGVFDLRKAARFVSTLDEEAATFLETLLK